MSTREELVATAEKWISLWIVPVDWELFDRLHSDDFEDLSSSGRPATKAGFAGGLKDFTDAFPDLQTKIEGLVVDAESCQVAVRWSARGTNRRRYLGVGPTNRVTLITGIEIVEIHGGRVTKRWGEWDITGHRQD